MVSKCTKIPPLSWRPLESRRTSVSSSQLLIVLSYQVERVLSVSFYRGRLDKWPPLLCEMGLGWLIASNYLDTRDLVANGDVLTCLSPLSARLNHGLFISH
ncbi:hypothetical protein J6590_005954, partial [Homalodisca vitripennis]